MRAKGYIINHKTVLKLMKSLNLKGKQRKNEKYHSYKGEVGKVAENLLQRGKAMRTKTWTGRQSFEGSMYTEKEKGKALALYDKTKSISF